MLYFRSLVIVLSFLALKAFANVVDSAARALITPAPHVVPRATSTELDSATCGFVSGRISSPLVCPSGYTCSSSYSITYRFACCNDLSCTNDYETCYGPSSTSSVYLSTTTYSCDDLSTCLSCTGSNSYCGAYFLTTSYDEDSAYRSAFCTDKSFHYVSVLQTPTNAPKSTILCVPDGFDAPHTSSSCTEPIVLLIPLILSNVIVFASGLLTSRLAFQNLAKFFGEHKDPDDPWAPWAGLGTAALVVVQAIATAALIRAGGYDANWTNLILLWLMRPRMQWAIMLFYATIGDAYKRAAADALTADGIINLLSLPTAAWLLQAVLKDDTCTLSYFPSNVINGFGREDYAGLYFVGVVMFFAFAAVDVFVLVFFFWPGRTRVHRGWMGLAGFYCMCVFVISWVFWIWWVFFSENKFCVTNIGPIAAIHAVVPFLTALTRAWLT